MINTGDYVTVSGYSGVAWYVQGKEQVWVSDEVTYSGDYFEFEDGEWVNGDDWITTMVGDDQEFIFPEDELTPIPDDDFCGGCGQVGCGHG